MMTEQRKKDLIEKCKEPALRTHIMSTIDQKKKYLEYLDFVFNEIIKKYYEEDLHLLHVGWFKPYFLANSADNGSKSKILKELIRFLYKNQENIPLITLNISIIQFISLLPLNDISEDEIKIIEDLIRKRDKDLFSSVDEFVIPMLLRMKKKEKYLIRIMDAFFEGAKDKYGSDEHWIEETMIKCHRTVSDTLGVTGFKHFTEKHIAEEKDYSVIFIHAVDGSGGKWHNFEWIFVVKFLTPYLESISDKFSKKELKWMLNHNHDIIKRFGLHLVRKRYDDFKDIFWSMHPNPLDNSDLRYELHAIFKENREVINKEDSFVDKFINWVESKDFSNLDRYEEYKDKNLRQRTEAFSKKSWLDSLYDNDSCHNEIRKKYEYYHSIYDKAIEDRDKYSSWSGDFESESDKKLKIVKDQITGKTLSEFIDFFEDKSNIKEWDYEMKRQFIFHRGSYQISINEKVSDNIDRLKKLDDFILCNLFDRNFINKILNSRADEDWNKILDFFIWKFESDEFWADREEMKKSKGDAPLYNFHDWLISDLVEVIKGISNRDDINFDESRARKILFILEDKCIADHDSDTYKDLATHTLNCNLGKVYRALILLSLHKARRERKGNSEAPWDSEIRGFFSDRLKDEKNKCLDLFFLIGNFFGQMLYLDKTWFKENIENIFRKDERVWKASFLGYFFSRRLHIDDYNLLKDQYSRSLDITFEGDESTDDFRVKDYSLCHILIYYFDECDGSKNLVEKILQKKEPKELDRLARFMKDRFSIREFFKINYEDASSNPESLKKIKEKFKNEKEKNKFFDLWEKLLNIGLKDEEKYKDLLQSLSEFVQCLEKIDNTHYDRIRKTVQFCNHSWIFVRILMYNLLISDDDDVMKRRVGELLGIAIQFKRIEYFDIFAGRREDNIKFILENIYETTANKINSKIFETFRKKLDLNFSKN